MKKIVSLLLVLIIFVCATTISTNATPSPMRYGDADGDFCVDILDATYVRLYVARYVTMDRGQLELSDVDDDGEVSVIDATMIQQKVAGLIDSFPTGKWIDNYYFIIEDIDVDYEGDRPLVGEAVTVTVDAECDWSPMIYAFYIDDVLVYASESNVLEYTFSKVGNYRLEVRVRNSLDFEQISIENIGVREA